MSSLQISNLFSANLKSNLKSLVSTMHFYFVSMRAVAENDTRAM